MLALVAALVLLGLIFELGPLIRLKDDVADRDALQLVPVCIERLPSELRPVVDAINQCIARLKLHATTQRKFIADAAHQLRTPLALLGEQIECAHSHGGTVAFRPHPEHVGLFVTVRLPRWRDGGKRDETAIGGGQH